MTTNGSTNGWTDPVDEILGGDQAVLLATVTAARGVVLTPLTNFATRDPRANRVTVNSSIGTWRKLDRIRANPAVALAFHTRQHGFSDRPEYVLVQGRATLSDPIPNYPATVGPDWERFAGPVGGPLTRRWLRIYHTRMSIDVAVERIVAWPDLACKGTPEVIGSPRPAEPPEPRPGPAKGTGPRVDVADVAAQVSPLPHAAVGWVDADGYPMVVSAELRGHDAGGLTLGIAEGLVPPGGRRAGLTAHDFTRYTLGQDQRVHTGWIEPLAGGGDATYAPHTTFGYSMRASKRVFNARVGLFTRMSLRAARRADDADEAAAPAG